MNELTFYVDEFESVKKCEYKENIKGCDYIYTIIKLPDKELHDLFVAYQRNNPKVTPKMTENGLMFTFYDIDVLAMDELINKSNIYREIMSKIGIINNVNFDKRKIVRKNRFKRTAISLSSVLFLSLTGFFMQKNNDQLKSTNINKIEYVNSANEDDDIDTDINNDHVNAIAYYLENETDIEENNLNTTTNEFDISNNSTHDSINADKPNKEEDYKMLRISADDWVDTDKYYVAKAYYFETITKYANMYGIDPNLVLAVATHESGIHSEQTNSSGAIGLFQIQVQGG